MGFHKEDLKKREVFFLNEVLCPIAGRDFTPQKSAEKDPTLGASNNIKNSHKLLRISKNTIYIYGSPPPRAHLRGRECISYQVWC